MIDLCYFVKFFTKYYFTILRKSKRSQQIRDRKALLVGELTEDLNIF